MYGIGLQKPNTAKRGVAMKGIGLLGYFRSLIKSGSGDSSKSFAVVAFTLTCVVLLLAVAFVLVWEVVHGGTVKTDLVGLAALVTSVAGLAGTAIGFKAWTDKKNEN